MGRHFPRLKTLFPSGCITALATPFTASGDLDMGAWRRLLEAQLQGGVQGVVVAGSTGEAATLNEQEYDRLLRSAVEVVGGRVPVLAGTGQMGTAKTVAQTRLAAGAGVDAALVVTPAYVRPTQAGLIAHFRAVAEDGGLPVVLYNVPSRTGTDLLPDTVAALADHPQVVGIKEACGDEARTAALAPLRRPGFAVLSGDDPTACRSMLAGFDGLISVGSNALPRAFRHLCDLARAGARAEAQAWDARLRDFYAFLCVEPNPIPLKALLQRLGFGEGLRLPLLPLSSAYHAVAVRFAHEAGALEEQACRDAVAA